MGYFVRHLKDKKSEPKWKVQYVSCKKKDQRKNSKAKSPKRTWSIPKKRWYSLGFHETMTLEEAKVRARQLNAQSKLKLQEEEILRFETKQAQYILRNGANLPEAFVEEFENRFINSQGNLTIEQLKRRNKMRYTAWRATQKAIVAINKEPEQWFYCTHEFYEYFYQKKFSINYANRILIFVNLWGNFISRKLCRPFHAIPRPQGYERYRIIDSFYTKKNRRKPSVSISPTQLNSTRDLLNQPNYNWLFLTVWLGLRPKEVDQLKNTENWRIEKSSVGRPVLWVFQTKPIARPPEQRWKPIPIIFEEQKFALKIVESQQFKRPIIKTVKKYFGKETDLYGGRKGFVDLMLSKGQELHNIQIWMGHATIARTWRHYKNKQVYHL